MIDRDEVLTKLTERISMTFDHAAKAALKAAWADIAALPEVQPQGEPVAITRTIATAPQRIWLNVGGGESNDEFPSNHEGITWCEDCIEEDDVPYIRADLAAPPEQPQGEPVNAEGPEHLGPQPAPGLHFDERGVLVPVAAPPAQSDAERLMELAMANPNAYASDLLVCIRDERAADKLSAAPPAQSSDRQEREELAMMIRRLARSLRLARPDYELPDDAMTLLRKHGLSGNVLRGVSMDDGIGRMVSFLQGYGDASGDEEFREAAALIEQLDRDNRDLRSHIEKRANGQDPLTVARRQRAEAAEAEDANLRKDAERYRWLRDEAPEKWAPWADERDNGDALPNEIDAAIDAARKVE